MSNYVAGSLFEKYSRVSGLDADKAIESEFDNVLRAINEYQQTEKQIKALDKKCDFKYDISEDESCNDSFDAIKGLMSRGKQEFVCELKRAGRSEQFFRSIMEYDRRSKEYQRELDALKLFEARVSDVRCNTLVIGILLGIIIHQLMMLF